MFVGLAFLAPSVYQMMRAFSLIVVAFNSVTVLKRKLFRHQILGAMFVIIGLIIIGISSVIYQAASASNPVLGILLILLSQVFLAWVYTLEELFVSFIIIDPLQVVGIEGLCGFGYSLILLPILYFIPCHLDFCIKGRVEDSTLAFEQIADNNFLALS